MINYQNKYYLYCVILEDCGYSNAAKELLNSHQQLKNKKEFTIVKRKDIEKYKTDEIQTYPQIYLKKQGSNDTQLIGGYTDIKNIFDTFYNNFNKEDLKIFLNNNKSLSKKGLLRLIELINAK